jgi:hypothetical protein
VRFDVHSVTFFPIPPRLANIDPLARTHAASQRPIAPSQLHTLALMDARSAQKYKTQTGETSRLSQMMLDVSIL